MISKQTKDSGKGPAKDGALGPFDFAAATSVGFAMAAQAVDMWFGVMTGMAKASQEMIEPHLKANAGEPAAYAPSEKPFEVTAKSALRTVVADTRADVAGSCGSRGRNARWGDHEQCFKVGCRRLGKIRRDCRIQIQGRKSAGQASAEAGPPPRRCVGRAWTSERGGGGSDRCRTSGSARHCGGTACACDNKRDCCAGRERYIWFSGSRSRKDSVFHDHAGRFPSAEGDRQAGGAGRSEASCRRRSEAGNRTERAWRLDFRAGRGLGAGGDRLGRRLSRP